jgi:sigma-B regulation protein RsbU (phosphoserine phosphatase)
VADVAGKGISAALLMATVQASLRSRAASVNGRLVELVSAMNRLLCESTDASNYATFFYAQFDETTRQLAYVNAGHNPPMLLRAGARMGAGTALRAASEAGAVATEVEAEAADCVIALLEAGGPVIGVFESVFYECETISVESGDVLVAYADGVTEALSPESEEFGEARLRRLVAESAHLSAEEIRERIVENVRDWRRDAPQHDDLTLVIMKVK